MPKMAIRPINEIVIKKLFLRSGNRSVSRIPLASNTGTTALNNIVDVATNNATMTIFAIMDEKEPGDNANGPIKKSIINNNDIPKIIQEYLVCSLYCAI